MRDCGISDVHIVVGHLGYQVASYFGDGSSYGVRIQFVEQESTLGLAHAVGALESRIQVPFLLMLGDIYFHLKAPLRPLCDQVLSGEVNANLVSMYEPDPEMVKRNFVIQADDTGRVHQGDRETALRQQPVEGLRAVCVRPAHLRRDPPHAAYRDARRIRNHRQHPDPDQRRLHHAPSSDRRARPQPDQARRPADDQPDRAGAKRPGEARRRVGEDAGRHA